ncbi:hypothetical protein ACFLYT_02140 [Nanoarchaeota archaeon]
MEHIGRSILAGVLIIAFMSGIAFMLGKSSGGITGATVAELCGEDCLSNLDCDDGNACTTDSCQTDGLCALTCSNVEVTGCADGDGCCPVGCSADSDC